MKKFIVLFLASLTVLFAASCGGTTVKVKQASDGVSATISVETNNPTSVDVNPSVSVKLDELDSFLNAVQDSLIFDENGVMTLSPAQVRTIVKSYN